jgi:pimeloyl-ACP methyl ester carboxylesterase
VVAPDLPRASVEELTAGLAGLSDASFVIGHSLGGLLALRYAAQRPASIPIVRGERSRRAALLGYRRTASPSRAS